MEETRICSPNVGAAYTLTSNLPLDALGPGNVTEGTVCRILRGCGSGRGGAGPNTGVGGRGGLSSASSSTDQSKISALRTAALLLSRVPERESSLLSAVANKLGYPGRVVVAYAGHVLRSTVLVGHTAIVGRGVELDEGTSDLRPADGGQSSTTVIAQ